MIYRVTVKTTSSLQPSGRDTSWDYDVVYCGTDLEEARIAYLRENPKDTFYGYGNRSRQTLIEQFESTPEEIDDCNPEPVDVDTE